MKKKIQNLPVLLPSGIDSVSATDSIKITQNIINMTWDEILVINLPFAATARIEMVRASGLYTV
jgi:hypothetical protein